MATANATSSRNATPTPAKLVGWAWANLVVPCFNFIMRVFRGVTSVHASLAFCLCLLATMACFSGMATLGALSLARHYTQVKADIIRPLEFDYSQPIAMAQVDLHDPLYAQTTYMGKIAQYLGYSGSTFEGELRYDAYSDSSDDDPVFEGYSDSGSQRGRDKGRGKRSVGNAAREHIGAKTAIVASNRPLNPGQPVSVTVKLEMPPYHSDLFQVTAELLDESGQVLIKSTRTHMARAPPPLQLALRYTLLLPLHVLGWFNDFTITTVKLVDGYVERTDSPLASVRVLLASRNASHGALPPPPVYGGQVQVKLKLNFARRVLHWLSPSWLTTLVVGGAAAALTLGSGVAALVLAIVALCLHRLRGTNQPAPSLAEQQRVAQELARVVRDTQAMFADQQGGRVRSRTRLGPGPYKTLIKEAPDDDVLAETSWEEAAMDEEEEEEGVMGQPGESEEEGEGGEESAVYGQASRQGGGQGESGSGSGLDQEEGREEWEALSSPDGAGESDGKLRREDWKAPAGRTANGRGVGAPEGEGIESVTARWEEAADGRVRRVASGPGQLGRAAANGASKVPGAAGGSFLGMRRAASGTQVPDEGQLPDLRKRR